MPPLRTLTNLEKSAESNVLWPPIADAIGTFVRRRAIGADGYELTWRLIHVWEAIAATLTAAITSRLRSVTGLGPSFLRAREHMHGRTWDPLSGTFKRSQAVLDGSATRRIDLLWELDSIDPTASRFLVSAKTFLKMSGLNLRALVSSWKQICDVPQDAASADQFTVREALRHVNSFRNRFAHVPFPYDEMGDLAAALSDVTEQLFSLDPKPWQSFPDDRPESPLNGCIECAGRRLRGKLEPQLCESDGDAPRFVFPAMPAKPADYRESWDAAPFVHVDSMFRPSILTRLVSESNGVWEYTRFLAERNSVIRYECPAYLVALAPPAASEYPAPIEEEEQEEAVVPAATPSVDGHPPAGADDAFGRALRDIANEDYEPAISFFRELVRRTPSYHIGWLRLGHAQRELALRKRYTDPTAALDLLNKSVDALTKATEHSHRPRQAQALYERSKAYYHRGRDPSAGDGAGRDVTLALRDAEEAYAITPDTKYETWIAYLQQHGARGGG